MTAGGQWPNPADIAVRSLTNYGMHARLSGCLSLSASITNFTLQHVGYVLRVLMSFTRCRFALLGSALFHTVYGAK